MKDSSYKFSQEPADSNTFTKNFDRFYSSFAWTYDLLVKSLPLWRNWLNHVSPYIVGTRVLEISFGTGYLLTHYTDRFQVYGIDYNAAMTKTVKANLSQRGLKAELQQADVNFLPFKCWHPDILHLRGLVQELMTFVLLTIHPIVRRHPPTLCSKRSRLTLPLQNAILNLEPVPTGWYM